MNTAVLMSIPVLTDNYVHVLAASPGQCVVVDPGSAVEVSEALGAKGLELKEIWLTHHHGDHTGGAEELRARTGARIVGATRDRARLPRLDVELKDSDVHRFDSLEARVLEIPGHTVGHIAFYLEQSEDLFCGDTLFLMGCGRLFEGSPEQMFTSLRRLTALPGSTRVWCGHEYTLQNGSFSLSVDPDNDALSERMAQVRSLRARNLPTLSGHMSVTVADELATNPFVRARDVNDFYRLRKLKDDFRFAG